MLNRTKSNIKLFVVSVFLESTAIALVAQGYTQFSDTPHFMSTITTDPTLNSSDQNPTPPVKSYNLTSRVVVDGAYAFNEALKYHPMKSDYLGTPLKNGRYHNPDYPFLLSFKDVRKWKKQTNPYLAFKKTDTFQLPVAADLSWMNNDSIDGVAWLGHATFLSEWAVLP